ncbi:DAPG hydrolase family protein [Acidovorax sp. A1169]|jgi:hypothetical protein|uniref:DAPG hydrolase family protein n=1 Tax=Acidovorax sp. A1169 TaxID=3059524 RepID=UPI002737FE5D|nr:hypothetical protein [Acidovorax sp. A1169]MDP4077018.1 hypothetical protein [Acidovorax sp. A1169]
MPAVLPHYQALPLPERLASRFPSVDVPACPASFKGVPPPVHLPWGLKPVGSAASGIDTLTDGRTRCWIRHEVVRGVTPRMLAWWFAHLEGDVEVGSVRINRYRVWHPYDHVHASYARRLPDGSVGPGAAIHLREMLGANPAFVVDVVTDIEKLDEEGFIHNPVVHGIRGLARMEYRFKAVAEGTQYENCLLFGGRGTVARSLHPLLSRLAFPAGKGAAWLRHNIEEVGMFENFLPGLYRQETGLDG